VKLLRADTENGRTIYERTPKGAKYLETFLEIKGLLKKTGKPNPIHTPPYWTKLKE
jgi:DNA-binding PadR family transcriptional regulator